MMPERRWGVLAGRVIHAVIALCAAAALLVLLAFGYGPVPALGRALDPGHGAWTSAAGGLPVRSQTLTVPGLAHPVAVAFTSHGVPSIRAADASDAFLALGYLQARFRLAEMDLERRLGEGRVAQLAGPAGVPSDKFELRLGLLRTAEQEWAQTSRSSPAGQALLAYSHGVNDYLAQARASGDWPSIFGLTGVYPATWTPVDSLVIQGVLTQELDFTTSPLDYAVLERTLGAAHTMSWFPVLPPNQQSPYDPGPYHYRGIAPIAPQATAVQTAVSKTGVRGRAAPVKGRVLGRAAGVALRPEASIDTRLGHDKARLHPRLPARNRRCTRPGADSNRTGSNRHRQQPPLKPCSRRSATCRPASSTVTRTATPGPPTARPWPAGCRCWPGTRTCRRPCPRSGTRRRCPRRAWPSPG